MWTPELIQATYDYACAQADRDTLAAEEAARQVNLLDRDKSAATIVGRLFVASESEITVYYLTKTSAEDGASNLDRPEEQP